jgi:hypothetical protein
MNKIMFIVTHHRQKHLDLPVHTVYTELRTMKCGSAFLNKGRMESSKY